MNAAREGRSWLGSWLALAGWVTLSVGLANLAAEVLIFGGVIAPSLEPGETAAPSTWVWMYVPVLLVVVGLTARVIEGYAEAVFAGVLSGVVAQVEKWALAVLGATGHEATLAAVAPSTFWTVHFARMTGGFVALFVVCLAIVRLARRRVRSG